MPRRLENARSSRRKLPLADGFDGIEAYLAGIGRSPTAFCACELRSLAHISWSSDNGSIAMRGPEIGTSSICRRVRGDDANVGAIMPDLFEFDPQSLACGRIELVPAVEQQQQTAPFGEPDHGILAWERRGGPAVQLDLVIAACYSREPRAHSI